MNEKLKYLTLFVIGMMLSLGMNAQSVKSISGTVTDDQGEAVISGSNYSAIWLRQSFKPQIRLE